jgi:chemotaxis receptor (MCP) glutamine deamidase CheD
MPTRSTLSKLLKFRLLRKLVAAGQVSKGTRKKVLKIKISGGAALLRQKGYRF